jgi:hypothetical protein
MKLDDFVVHPRTGVHVPADEGVPAGYLDGAERYLLDVLRTATDRSLASDELRDFVRDWASHYHLTPYRGTLLDCLGFSTRTAKVLELGAGCGAVTRWLGENCGEVHAVEGNIERAGVARTRCADLDNVEVYCANYSQLEVGGLYDVSTLIGVLEYGHLYHPDTNVPYEAALDNLRIARRAIHDDGVFVLAIENKLGLKYFAGAREDHSGKPFESINGYPHAQSAVTFSAREIEQLLGAAGFGAAEWYVPYPDYKLARTIVNLQTVRDEHHIENWLEGPAPDRGHQRRGLTTFNETLAQREIVRAGLLKDLANSFLVLAYAGDPSATHERLGIETDWTARHYSLDRRAGFRKRATLTPEAEVVREENVFTAQPRGREATTLGAFEHRFSDEPFRGGELLVHRVLGTVSALGLDAAFHEHVRELGRWLVDVYGTGGVDETGAALLDGAALDALWWNVVIDADGAWSAIDGEWRFCGVLPTDYLLWRALVQFRLRFVDYLPEPWRSAGGPEFAAAQLEQACGARPAQRLTEFLQLESAFAGIASPGDVPAAPPVVQRLVALGDQAQRVAVLAFADEVADRPGLLREFAGQFGPADRTSLLLAPPVASASDTVDRLRAAIAASGVAEDELPDLLLLGHAPQVTNDTAILAGVSAVLSERRLDGPLDGLPRFDGHQVAELRDLLAGVPA